MALKEIKTAAGRGLGDAMQAGLLDKHQHTDGGANDMGSSS